MDIGTILAPLGVPGWRHGRYLAGRRQRHQCKYCWLCPHLRPEHYGRHALPCCKHAEPERSDLMLANCPPQRKFTALELTMVGVERIKEWVTTQRYSISQLMSLADTRRLPKSLQKSSNRVHLQDGMFQMLRLITHPDMVPGHIEEK